jgi:hypothetical protein
LSKTPLQLFEYVFDDFINFAISYIEKYAEKICQLEIELDKDDIYKYLFSLIYINYYLNILV